MALMRLQKYLSENGICSRRKAEEYIKNGEVSVNEKTITELGTKIDPQKDKIYFKGKLIKNQNKKIYLILNKPKGYVTSFEHEGKKTIKEFLKGFPHLAYAGRLDEDSRGLVFLSNDGDLINKLTHPRYEHEKEYIVETEKPITDFELDLLTNGIELEEGKTKKCKVYKINDNKFGIILEEGWNRQIRRMLAKIGHETKDLERIRINNIRLDNLKEGKIKILNEEDSNRIKGCMENL